MGRAELTAGTSETFAGKSILQNKRPSCGRMGVLILYYWKCGNCKL